MKANVRSKKTLSRDEGVSPVIAVILMVAITVVLAATVYVWVSGFASEDSGPEQASATARGFAVGGSDNNWIRVTLVKGENAPYNQSTVGMALLDPAGNSFSATEGTDYFLCTSASASLSGSDAVCGTGIGFQETATNTWDVGEVLYVPCQDDGSTGSGDHSITITVRGTTILDSTVKCEAAAAT